MLTKVYQTCISRPVERLWWLFTFVVKCGKGEPSKRRLPGASKGGGRTKTQRWIGGKGKNFKRGKTFSGLKKRGDLILTVTKEMGGTGGHGWGNENDGPRIVFPRFIRIKKRWVVTKLRHRKKVGEVGEIGASNFMKRNREKRRIGDFTGNPMRVGSHNLSG